MGYLFLKYLGLIDIYNYIDFDKKQGNPFHMSN